MSGRTVSIGIGTGEDDTKVHQSDTITFSFRKEPTMRKLAITFSALLSACTAAPSAQVSPAPQEPAPAAASGVEVLPPNAATIPLEVTIRDSGVTAPSLTGAGGRAIELTNASTHPVRISIVPAAGGDSLAKTELQAGRNAAFALVDLPPGDYRIIVSFIDTGATVEHTFRTQTPPKAVR